MSFKQPMRASSAVFLAFVAALVGIFFAVATGRMPVDAIPTASIDSGIDSSIVAAPDAPFAIEAHRVGMGIPMPTPGDAGSYLCSNGPGQPVGWCSLGGNGVVSGQIPGVNLFGDGSDGAAICDGTTSVTCMSLSGGAYTQTRDCFFSSLTINNAITVSQAGFGIWVSSRFTNNGIVSVAGGVGLDGGGAGGAGGGSGKSPTAAHYGGGSLGGSAGGSGATMTNCAGGRGGCSVCPGGDNTCTPPAAQYGSPHDYLRAIAGNLPGVTSGSLSYQFFLGGTGGDSFGGLTPYAGGGGGGVGATTALILVGNGTFTANGGTGSYGGGGGVYILGFRDKTLFTGTVTAAGGLTVFDAGGANGSPGSVLLFQL